MDGYDQTDCVSSEIYEADLCRGHWAMKNNNKANTQIIQLLYIHHNNATVSAYNTDV